MAKSGSTAAAIAEIDVGSFGYQRTLSCPDAILEALAEPMPEVREFTTEQLVVMLCPVTGMRYIPACDVLVAQNATDADFAELTRLHDERTTRVLLQMKSHLRAVLGPQGIGETLEAKRITAERLIKEWDASVDKRNELSEFLRMVYSKKNGRALAKQQAAQRAALLLQVPAEQPLLDDEADAEMLRRELARELYKGPHVVHTSD